jgi:DNA-binding NarL/FixJ family response regulator
MLSVRTVDSHVAAVLGKLDAGSRRDVAARLARPPGRRTGPTNRSGATT